MTNITILVVKKEQNNTIRQIKKKLKKKEILKYWFMPENEKEIIRQRSLERYFKMKSR